MQAIARVGDRVFAPACIHGCSLCPHPVSGSALWGAGSVLVEAQAALALGDGGTHQQCCGANLWQVSEGSRSVFVEGRPLARLGDQSLHCGGVGHIQQGAASVFSG